jgi:hypothetical protein
MVLFFYVLFVPVILLFLLLGVVKQHVLIEHLKQVFIIVDPLPIRGYQKAAGLVLLSVLLYQILVYHNPKTKHQQPKAIKHTCYLANQ